MLTRLLQAAPLLAAGVLLLHASASAAPGNAPFTSCSPTSALTIKSLQFDPNPPSIKKPFVYILNGNLTKTINKGARAVVTATLGSMVVSNQTVDLCEEVAKSGLSCPLAPGNYTLRSIVPIPTGVQIPPFVGIKVHVEGFNADNSKLFCVDTSVKFTP